MITLKQGDIFTSEADAIINPVNVEGFMGKGLAFQFKKKYPENFKKYQAACADKTFYIGSDLVWTKESEKIIINFPTKDKWRENSKIEYIQIGLERLKKIIESENIKSIAIPPLGAGNGKLKWDLVKEEIINFANSIAQNINVIIYEPEIDTLNLGRGHFIIANILNTAYNNGIKKSELSDLILQKLVYISDENNYFKFKKELKGPFSKLLNIQYNELQNYCRMKKVKLKEVVNELYKINTSKNLEQDNKNIENTIIVFKRLRNFYSIEDIKRSEDKIELLSTILYLIKDYPLINTENLYINLVNWNKRKAGKYTKVDVEEMCQFLISCNILYYDIFGELKYKKIS